MKQVEGLERVDCGDSPGGETYTRDSGSTMTLDAVVERISRLPVDFSAGSKSMVQLISESDVARFPSALSVQRLCTYIAANPQNKQVSAGWYFIRRASGFALGFHPDGEVLNISDPIPRLRRICCS
jgi:hypothetical protein